MDGITKYDTLFLSTILKYKKEITEPSLAPETPFFF